MKKCHRWKPWIGLLLATGNSVAVAEINNGFAIQIDSKNYVFGASFGAQSRHRQVLLDRDGKSDTGFQINGLGADYLIEDGALYRYDPNGQQWRFKAEIPSDNFGKASRWLVPSKLIEPSGPVAAVFAVSDGQNVFELSDNVSTHQFEVRSRSLAPYRMKTRRGSQSDQPLAVLASKDLSGTTDDWDQYIEFYTDDNGYAGEFAVRLPGDLEVPDLAAFEVKTNFRGEMGKYQRWRWKIYDASVKRWRIIGDNMKAPNWRWKYFKFPVLGMPSRFVNARNQVRLRFETSKDTDDSQLDLLKLVVHTKVALPEESPEGADPENPKAEDPKPDDSKPDDSKPDDSKPDDSKPDDSKPDDSKPDDSGQTLWHPKPGDSWQWQISGSLDQSVDVDIFDVDLFDTPQATIEALHSRGKRVICYFSAGTYENWRPDKSSFPAKVIGKKLGDWDGEWWLDVGNLKELKPIMAKRLQLAKDKGCDGVEPDNVDGYDNDTGFSLSQSDQLSFNRMLAQEAHKRGLSIGLKNSLDLVEQLQNEFDWALNEQCFQYQECERLQPFVAAGKAVLGVSYGGTGKASSVCPKANAMGFTWLIKKLDLDAWRIDCKDY